MDGLSHDFPLTAFCLRSTYVYTSIYKYVCICTRQVNFACVCFIFIPSPCRIEKSICSTASNSCHMRSTATAIFCVCQQWRVPYCRGIRREAGHSARKHHRLFVFFFIFSALKCGTAERGGYWGGKKMSGGTTKYVSVLTCPLLSSRLSQC